MNSKSPEIEGAYSPEIGDGVLHGDRKTAKLPLKAAAVLGASLLTEKLLGKPSVPHSLPEVGTDTPAELQHGAPLEPTEVPKHQTFEK